MYPHQTFSQKLTQTIKGKVTEATTKRPLSEVSIILLNSNPLQGTTTDTDGYFKLQNVPVGRQSFFVSFLGYEDALISKILIGSAKEIDLTIQLVESINQLKTIEITSSKNNAKAHNKMATVSTRSFSVEETKRFPASISDPGRMALSFAGVTNSDDSSNEIIIRGNAPNQLLWRVEGIEVPEPNHFSEEGYSSGTVGMISTNLLGKSDFFTGAFPAEYGNALSGVFDINLRNGNPDKNEYAFQFGLLGTDLAVEGPFNKDYKGSYLINYRYSTLEFLNNIIEVVDNSVPKYQDLSFKINLPLTKKTNLSLWGVGGFSESDKSPEMINEYLIEDDYFDSKTYMTGINLQHFITDKSTLNVILSYSGKESNYKSVEIFLYNNTEVAYRNSFKNKALRASLKLTHKLNTKTTLQAGTILSYLDYKIIENNTINQIKGFELDQNNNANMAQAFVQVIHRFNNKTSSTFGLHSTYFSLNNNFVLEPRAGVTYKINSKHTINAGLGKHSKRMNLNQYFIDNNYDNVFSNKSLDLMQANHYVLGYDWRIIKNGHLKFETYYQAINKVAVGANGESTASVINGDILELDLTNTGKAKNYGIELTFEKFFSSQYYFLATTSIFNSKYRASDNNWYNSKFNSNYTFNLVGGKEFSVKENNLLGINAKVLFNGGQRNSPVDIDVFYQTGEISFIQKQRNTISLKDYFRLDLSAYYRINKPKTAHVFSFDIQNITNTKNIKSLNFNGNTAVYEANYQLSLTPTFNYRIEF